MGEKLNVKSMENGIKRKARNLSFLSQCMNWDGQKSQPRLVNKDGSYRIDHIHPPHGLIKHFRNTFPFLLEIRWRWIILGCSVCFPFSWAIFALVYYAIASVNGDFVVQNSINDSIISPIQCVSNVKGFADMFLFSVESQQTIGYGFRYPNDGCPSLIAVLCFQYVAGAVLQGCICGIVWARLVRPKRRGQEVVFSQYAVINRDKYGRLCFSFRLTDIAGNHLVQLSVRMYLAKKKKVHELFSFNLKHMNLGQENGRDRMLLLWPSLVTHVIDKDSPLYKYSKTGLEKSDFEIIAIVEGIVESTGLTAQTRTSYLPNEILWGRRFQPMNFIGQHKSRVKIHYVEFENTFPVDTPTMSALELEKLRQHDKSS